METDLENKEEVLVTSNIDVDKYNPFWFVRNTNFPHLCAVPCTMNLAPLSFLLDTSVRFLRIDGMDYTYFEKFIDL